MKKRRKREPKTKRKKGIYLLPNLFTSASLFGGFYAVVAAIQGKYEMAAVAILLSCLLDGLDGRIARFTNTASAFGTEYDSLSDLVAFGMAPGILAFQWALKPFGRLGWLAAFTYVICGALRLARFNVQKNTMEPNFFKGLPIPAAGSFIASLVLFTNALGVLPDSKHLVIIVVVYLLSFLMVSSIGYLSFKGLELKKQKPFNVLVAIILILLVIAYKPNIMLFFVLSVYVLSGPVMALFHVQKKRASQPAPLEDIPQIKPSAQS